MQLNHIFPYRNTVSYTEIYRANKIRPIYLPDCKLLNKIIKEERQNTDYWHGKYDALEKVYDGVKVLGNLKPEETFNKKYTVKATKFSKAAKEAIEAAGGTVEVI